MQSKIDKEKIKETLRFVGLDPYDKKHVEKYSLGMRQRLGLAQAIMEDPDILILDEPMNGLDKTRSTGNKRMPAGFTWSGEDNFDCISQC